MIGRLGVGSWGGEKVGRAATLRGNHKDMASRSPEPRDSARWQVTTRMG